MINYLIFNMLAVEVGNVRSAHGHGVLRSFNKKSCGCSLANGIADKQRIIVEIRTSLH